MKPKSTPVCTPKMTCFCSPKFYSIFKLLVIFDLRNGAQIGPNFDSGEKLFGLGSPPRTLGMTFSILGRFPTPNGPNMDPRGPKCSQNQFKMDSKMSQNIWKKSVVLLLLVLLLLLLLVISVWFADFRGLPGFADFLVSRWGLEDSQCRRVVLLLLLLVLLLLALPFFSVC